MLCVCLSAIAGCNGDSHFAVEGIPGKNIVITKADKVVCSPEFMQLNLSETSFEEIRNQFNQLLADNDINTDECYTPESRLEKCDWCKINCAVGGHAELAVAALTPPPLDAILGAVALAKTATCLLSC